MSGKNSPVKTNRAFKKLKGKESQAREGVITKKIYVYAFFLTDWIVIDTYNPYKFFLII